MRTELSLAQWAARCGVTYRVLRDRARSYGIQNALVRSLQRPGPWKRGAVLDAGRDRRATALTHEGRTNSIAGWAALVSIDKSSMAHRVARLGAPLALAVSLAHPGPWGRHAAPRILAAFTGAPCRG